jgi:hypothetical protein
MCCEDEILVFERESTHIARKNHLCCECQRVIRHGERYHKFVGKWKYDTFSDDGHFGEYKTCEACEDDWNKLIKIYMEVYDDPSNEHDYLFPFARTFGVLRETIEEAVELGFLGEGNRRYRRWIHMR